jgi:hypothetical protein
MPGEENGLEGGQAGGGLGDFPLEMTSRLAAPPPHPQGPDVPNKVVEADVVHLSFESDIVDSLPEAIDSYSEVYEPDEEDGPHCSAVPSGAGSMGDTEDQTEMVPMLAQEGDLDSPPPTTVLVEQGYDSANDGDSDKPQLEGSSHLDPEPEELSVPVSFFRPNHKVTTPLLNSVSAHPDP